MSEQHDFTNPETVADILKAVSVLVPIAKSVKWFLTLLIVAVGGLSLWLTNVQGKIDTWDATATDLKLTKEAMKTAVSTLQEQVETGNRNVFQIGTALKYKLGLDLNLERGSR